MGLADSVQHFNLILLEFFALFTAFPLHAGIQFFDEITHIGWRGDHLDMYIFGPCSDNTAKLCDNGILFCR